MRIRKIAVVDSYPSKGVEKKVQSVVLGDETTRFLTRKDIAALIKDESFSKAPNTVAFLEETKAAAKEAGAYHVKFSASETAVA